MKGKGKPILSIKIRFAQKPVASRPRPKERDVARSESLVSFPSDTNLAVASVFWDLLLHGQEKNIH